MRDGGNRDGQIKRMKQKKRECVGTSSREKTAIEREREREREREKEIQTIIEVQGREREIQTILNARERE